MTFIKVMGWVLVYLLACTEAVCVWAALSCPVGFLRFMFWASVPLPVVIGIVILVELRRG